MKEISKSVTVGAVMFLILIIALLFIINSNIPNKISCEPPRGDVIYCDFSKFSLFRSLWIVISVVISLGAGLWYFKRK